MGDNKPMRDEKGRIMKGSSGNPRGRPSLPDWFKAAGEDALRYLVDVVKGDEFVEPDLRLRAATEVVTRVYGKPDSSIEVGVSADGVGTLTVAFVAADKKNDDEV